MNCSNYDNKDTPATSHSGETKQNMRRKVIMYMMMSLHEFKELEMSSSHETDITWYGLFDVTTNKMVDIKAASGRTKPSHPRMSTYKTPLDKSMRQHVLSLVQSGELSGLYILCIGYAAGDAQIGVTGTVEDEDKYVHMTAHRELTEETGITYLGWFQQIACGSSRRCNWTGFIGGFGAKCFCSDAARRDGWECCASGYGRCAPLVPTTGPEFSSDPAGDGPTPPETKHNVSSELQETVIQMLSNTAHLSTPELVIAEYDNIARVIICHPSLANCHNPIQKAMELVLPTLTSVSTVDSALVFMTRQVITQNMTTSRKWFVNNIKQVRENIGHQVWKQIIAKTFGKLLAVCEDGDLIRPRVPRWLYCLNEQTNMDVDMSQPIAQIHSGKGTEPWCKFSEPRITKVPYYPSRCCFMNAGGVIYYYLKTTDGMEWLIMLVRKSYTDYWLPYTGVQLRYAMRCSRFKTSENWVTQTEENIIQMFGFCMSDRFIMEITSQECEAVFACNSCGEIKVMGPILDWQLEVAKWKAKLNLAWTDMELFDPLVEPDNVACTPTDACAYPKAMLSLYVIKHLSDENPEDAA